MVCSRCHHEYCSECQPYWDYESETCAACQEVETITTIQENDFTGRMRRWFNKRAPEPKPPKLSQPLPWSAVTVRDRHFLMANGFVVARFTDRDDCEWAARAANHHYQLSGLLAETYNRIRDGGAYFSGSEKDCKLWQEMIKALKK